MTRTNIPDPILAVDPGLSGAIALYDPSTGELQITDMPVVSMLISKKNRAILNEDELIATLELYKAIGVKNIVIEHVQGLPRQSAPAAFSFGYGFAFLVCASRMLGFQIEKVKPERWKVQMKVPSGVNKSTAVRQRAGEIIPTHKHLWPLAKHDGRAEAAMLAVYAERFLFKRGK